jgi:hypothetical protein
LHGPPGGGDTALAKVTWNFVSKHVMELKCKSCGAPVPSEKRDCQACGEDNGAPNVRLAQSEAERKAIARRQKDAETSTRARNCCDVLDRFGSAVLTSHAVIARSLAVVQDVIEGGRTYTNYYRQTASGARLAADNDWDRTRTQVDAALFPNFHQDILFASLSLDCRGLSGYGEYVMVLKEPLIAKRASVFEANAYALVEKLGWLLTKPIPPGYRASWNERDQLAKAKLYAELTANTQDADFPSILVNDCGGTGNSDFIEVHIYGPLNKYSVEKIVGPKPRTREDRLIAKRLERQLYEIGATLEMT